MDNENDNDDFEEFDDVDDSDTVIGEKFPW